MTLTAANLPAHTHVVNAAVDAAELMEPEGAALATTQSLKMYSNAPAALTMHGSAISESVVPATGQPYGTPNPLPHENMQPFQSINYIICLEGIFPPQN